MKKKIEVIQEEASDCGVCCLLSIIRYYGRDASLENLRISSLTTNRGVSAYNLLECAKQYGFDSVGMKVTDLNNSYLPYIAHLNINNTLSHFVVVYEIKKENILIMDPSYGLKRINKTEFLKSFSGTILILKPKDKIKEETVKNMLWGKVLTEVWRSKFKIMAMILLNILLIVLSIFYSNYVTVLNKNISIIPFFIILILLMKFINYVLFDINVKLSNLNRKRITKNFLEHVFYLPLRILHLKDPGEIIKRIDELDEVMEVINNFFLTIILSSIYIISILIFISLIDISISLIILICFIFILIIISKFYKNIGYKLNDYIYKSTDYNKTLQNDINCLESIKHLNQEKHFIDNLYAKYQNYLDSSIKVKKSINFIEFIKSTILSITDILIIYLLIKSNESIEMIFMIEILINFLFSSFEQLVNIVPEYLLEKKLIRKIDEFYQINIINKGKNKFVNGDIEFKNINFSYNNKRLLSNISFKIKNKDKVMIDGVSGSGKSTLMKMLIRENDDYKGVITIKNENIKNMDVNAIKDNILYLSQNERFINGTIKENILFGRNISEEQFNNIIQICKLDKVVNNYPLKYDTYIFNDNNSLSGGEKGLVILARSLVSKKDIIIIDEVLSELDKSIEIEVLNNLKRYVDSTIIYISHKENKVFKRIINVRKE